MTSQLPLPPANVHRGHSPNRQIRWMQNGQPVPRHQPEAMLHAEPKKISEAQTHTSPSASQQPLSLDPVDPEQQLFDEYKSEKIAYD